MQSGTLLADFARDPDRPRVLIARTSAIGDTILTAPVACRLRDLFPRARIAWVVEEKSALFVEDHPAIDEAIVLPRGWFTRPRDVLALRRRLRPMRFDAAIDCQGLTKTALACFVSGAAVRVGLRGEHGRELSGWLNNRLVEPRTTHVTDRSLELVAALVGDRGAGDPVRWDLPRVTAAENKIAVWLAKSGAAPDQGYAVINPGASWDSKLWEADRFAVLAARMGKELGLTSIVVWGGDRERGWAEQIVDGANGRAVMAPSTSLHELAALLREARLVVSPDTGPMHLAVAVGAPTVGLFGATLPRDCGPYGPPHAAVMRATTPGGRRARRRADNAAMRAIRVDDAYEACRAVLDATADRFPAAPVAMAS